MISALAACLGALLSLRTVVALPPAEAMRPESWPNLKREYPLTLGFARLLSISTRMILRNLGRRPVESLSHGSWGCRLQSRF